MSVIEEPAVMDMKVPDVDERLAFSKLGLSRLIRAFPNYGYKIDGTIFTISKMLSTAVGTGNVTYQLNETSFGPYFFDAIAFILSRHDNFQLVNNFRNDFERFLFSHVIWRDFRLMDVEKLPDGEDGPDVKDVRLAKKAMDLVIGMLKDFVFTVPPSARVMSSRAASRKLKKFERANVEITMPLSQRLHGRDESGNGMAITPNDVPIHPHGRNLGPKKIAQRARNSVRLAREARATHNETGCRCIYDGKLACPIHGAAPTVPVTKEDNILRPDIVFDTSVSDGNVGIADAPRS